MHGDEARRYGFPPAWCRGSTCSPTSSTPPSTGGARRGSAAVDSAAGSSPRSTTGSPSTSLATEVDGTVHADVARDRTSPCARRRSCRSSTATRVAPGRRSTTSRTAAARARPTTRRGRGAPPGAGHRARDAARGLPRRTGGRLPRRDLRDRAAAFVYGHLAHPGWLLRFANWALSNTVRLGPWIHVSSDPRMVAPVHDGDQLEVRARVTDRYERKGHEIVDLWPSTSWRARRWRGRPPGHLATTFAR